MPVSTIADWWNILSANMLISFLLASPYFCLVHLENKEKKIYERWVSGWIIRSMPRKKYNDFKLVTQNDQVYGEIADKPTNALHMSK